MFGASSKLASVMEFGFYRTVLCRLSIKRYLTHSSTRSASDSLETYGAAVTTDNVIITDDVITTDSVIRLSLIV